MCTCCFAFVDGFLLFSSSLQGGTSSVQVSTTLSYHRNHQKPSGIVCLPAAALHYFCLKHNFTVEKSLFNICSHCLLLSPFTICYPFEWVSHNSCPHTLWCDVTNGGYIYWMSQTIKFGSVVLKSLENWKTCRTFCKYLPHNYELTTWMYFLSFRWLVSLSC